MKKLAPYIWILVLLVSIETKAQTFKPGVLVGLVTSQVGGDGYSGFNKLGLTFGGYVRYQLSDNWSTQFEIAYVQKGSRNNFSISESDPNQASQYFLMRLNYIEIPLMFKFSHRNFIYEIGAYYGQLVGFYYEYRDDFGGASGPFESADELNSEIERIAAQSGNSDPAYLKDYDVGLIIGFGYKINDNLLGSLRYSNSILPIRPNDSGSVDLYPTSINLGWTNTVINATLRYTFGQGDEKVFVDPKKKNQ